MNRLIIKIISWMLHHANRDTCNTEYFYSIKTIILNKFKAKLEGYDIQHIPGKKCYSCNGTGIHSYIDWDGNVYDSDACWHCYDGWYKCPAWNVLKKVKLGDYYFHQPIQRSYNKPDIIGPVFEGYISHDKTKYTKWCKTILHLMFEKGYVKRYYKECIGWRLMWWLPKNWLHNIIHLIKNGRNSIPILRIREKYIRKFVYKRHEPVNIDDLPF